MDVINGTGCNDNNPCTQTDTCQNGTCVGSNPKTCPPPSDQCQVNVCSMATGACVSMPVTNGTSCTNTNPCALTASCQAGTCTAVPASDGTPCAAGEVCSSGTCVADCFISGMLHTSGTVNSANACQVCTPSSSTTAWSNEADGTSCGTGQICAAGSCESGCFISGTVYAAGTPNPADPCQGCDPATSTTAWTDDPDSSTCSGGNPIPAVVTTSPANGATPVAGPTITITFNTAMDPTTLTAQTSAGACSGQFTMSHNGHMSCDSFASATPVMSANNTVATFTAAPGLLVNRGYGLTILGAKSAAGVSMPSYSWSFTTISPTSPVVLNESGSALEVAYCDMQFPTSYPSSNGGQAGDVVTMYGQVYQPGVTGNGGSHSATAQFGYAPANADGSPRSNPEYEAAWMWSSATYNASCSDCGSGNDEYQYSFTLPATGYYYYTYRISLDGGSSWTVCDVGGAGTNGGLSAFDFNLLSQLQVN